MRENKMIACAACGAALRYLTGDAAVLGNEGSGWLQLDSRTPRRPGRAAGTHHERCGDVWEQQRGPREVTSLD